MIASAPSASAFVTATVMPRSLNDPVGRSGTTVLLDHGGDTNIKPPQDSSNAGENSGPVERHEAEVVLALVLRERADRERAQRRLRDAPRRDADAIADGAVAHGGD